MLSFAAPWVLAGLLALPALWWLLRATPPPPRKVVFGGTIFLERLADATETPARTPWWLLLLRLVALAALIVGLAAPLWGADRQRLSGRPLLIIVDNGWPAANEWRNRVRALEELTTRPGANEVAAQYVLTAGTNDVSEPMPLARAVDDIQSKRPVAALPDRLALLSSLESIRLGETDVLWLSDGVIGRRGADREFLRQLSDAAELTIYRPTQQSRTAIRQVAAEAAGLSAVIERIGAAPADARLLATAADGRTIAEVPIVWPGNDARTAVTLDLPIELRNDIVRLSVGGESTAGAQWLLDAGARRIRAGLVSSAADSLLDGGFYIDAALRQVAEVVRADVVTLAVPEIGLIILDDIGTLRPSEDIALMEWVERGGVLLRFAGPNTANAEAARNPETATTFPLPLRGSERAFGGALTWEQPQTIAEFSDDGIFVGLRPSDATTVRRQVLTRTTGTDGGAMVRARLSDGTPLITMRQAGRGQLILVHVTASPTWSDLPVSEVFAEMMARVARLATSAPAAVPGTALAPLRLLDGTGQWTDPPPEAPPRPAGEVAYGDVPPGLYGSAQAALAINTYPDGAPALDALSVSLLPSGALLRGNDATDVRALGPAFMAAALLLLALDGVVLALRRRAASTGLALVLVLIASATTLPQDAHAQSNIDLRPPLDDRTIRGSLEVRFAYVITGDPVIDRLSEAGLYGIAREATRRSALEPFDPVGVDIESDDLSVYPLIYWPVLARTAAPSDGALSRLERFMAGGGMLIIDTQDGELRQTDAETPAEIVLRRILRRMDIPTLAPVEPGHILTKSFYLLNELPGRNLGGTVWVEAQTALSETTDNVPTLIIGARDWAAAWALDRSGTPLRAAGTYGERGREMAIRTGINFAMVALTGNYKGDQVHVQELLDRLGEEPFAP